MANVIFKMGTQAAYDALTEKDSNTLYWLYDTQAFYKGDVLYGVGAEASETAAGLMSAEDKANLDSLVSSGTTGDSSSSLDMVYVTDVYFDSDLVFTETFGRYEPDSSTGSVTIEAEGKTLYAVLMDAFSQDKNPTITQPSVSLTASLNKAYEVGTAVAPTYSASLNAGSYEYGPDTGVEVTAWSVTDTNGETLETASGTFTEFTVTDSTSYYITATASYSDGAVPVTALGAEYADGQITAGTASKTSSKLYGYRNTFYGTLESKDDEIDSALVRSLTSTSGKALSDGSSFTITIPTGAVRVVFAYPATLGEVASVTDTNGMSAEISSAFTQYTVDVEGANSYDAISYYVYVTDFASANDTANTYKVTI